MYPVVLRILYKTRNLHFSDVSVRGRVSHIHGTLRQLKHIDQSVW